MSDIDPEIVGLIRELLIHTDMLGVGHQTHAQDIAHRLDLAGKVIIDKGSVPEWMEQSHWAATGKGWRAECGGEKPKYGEEPLYRIKGQADS